MAGLTTVPDLIESASVTEDLTGGRSAVRTFLVHGVVGDANRKVFDALSVSAIPNVDDPHPVYGDIFVRRVHGEAIDTGAVKVTVDYGVPQVGTEFPGIPDDLATPQIEVGSLPSEVETWYDHAGNDIFTQHRQDDSGQRIKEYGSVRKQDSDLFIRYSRHESNNPIAKAAAFTDKINAATFAGFPPHTLLCKSITGTSDDGGLTYNVRYEFQGHEGGDLQNGNPQGWDAVVIEKDDDGSRVSDPEWGFGLMSYQVYKEADFSQLNLE